jgi:CheY-like chemotaxis protein
MYKITDLNKKEKKVPGKIILVDDDKKEKKLLEAALWEREWNIKVDYFQKANDALEALKKCNKDEVFLIISNMNMDGMNGLDFKKAIDKDATLREKGIPFIFASASATQQQIDKAYALGIQGFFTKPISLDEQAEIMDMIVSYWSRNTHHAIEV